MTTFPGDTLWLQDPRFDGLTPIETLGRYRDREAVARRVLAAHRPGLANVHMLLRKRFTSQTRHSQRCKFGMFHLAPLLIILEPWR